MQREFQSAGLFYEMENMLGSFNKNLEVEDWKDNIIKLLSREWQGWVKSSGQSNATNATVLACFWRPEIVIREKDIHFGLQQELKESQSLSVGPSMTFVMSCF